MKMNLLKSLLLVAGMVVGATSAWGENTYKVLYGIPTYAVDGITITGVTPQTDFTAEDGTTKSDYTHTDANGANCNNAMPVGGSVLSSEASFNKYFETPATKGSVHFEANYTATTNGQETFKVVDSNGIEIFGTTDSGYSNGNANKSWGFCNGVSLGTNYFRQARNGHNRVVLDINLSTKVVSYTVLVSSGNNSYTTLTGNYNLPASVNDVNGLSVTKGNYAAYMDNVSFYNVYDDAATEYQYTINYQYNGETVSSSIGSAIEGATVESETSIWSNDKKYFVKSGETTSFEITSGTNIFNVDVRLAETWSYTIKALLNEEPLCDISTKTVVEGEATSYGYPQYISVAGILYKSSAQSGNPWWGKSFTPVSNNETQNINYTAEGTTGIVFCKEAEDIETLTPVTGGNTDIRASNRAGAYASSEAIITTLPSGLYKMMGATYGNAGITFSFKAGDATVFEMTTNGNPVHTIGDTFFLTEETDITVTGGNGGNSPKTIDYIIIQKIGSVSATITAAGYATYCSPYALDFTNVEGLKAYTATASEKTVSFNEVNGKVPANTGLLLKGEAKEYEIPVAASADDVENVLVGVTEATAKEAGIFVLMNGAEGVGFYKTAAEFTVGANTAYLPASAAAGRTFIGFAEDETTAIAATKSANANEKEMFNLQGQRVKTAQKGLYIVGGKKMVVK